MPNVRDVMTSEPITMDVNTVISAVARQMRDEAIGDVIVTDGGRLCGIVTDRDIAVRAVASDADPRATTVRDVLTREPVTVAPDDDIKAAEGLMRTHAVKRLPVVEGDRIVGVVALGDIEVEETPDSLEAAIAAEDPNN